LKNNTKSEAVLSPSALLRERIYNFILRSGNAGVTDEEIRLALNVAGDSQRPRRRELVEINLVGSTGKRRRIKTGRTATIWKATRVLEKNNTRTR
jgi:hypothetical protein